MGREGGFRVQFEFNSKFIFLWGGGGSSSSVRIRVQFDILVLLGEGGSSSSVRVQFKFRFSSNSVLTHFFWGGVGGEFEFSSSAVGYIMPACCMGQAMLAVLGAIVPFK